MTYIFCKDNLDTQSYWNHSRQISQPAPLPGATHWWSTPFVPLHEPKIRVKKAIERELCSDIYTNGLKKKGRAKKSV